MPATQARFSALVESSGYIPVANRQRQLNWQASILPASLGIRGKGTAQAVMALKKVLRGGSSGRSLKCVGLLVLAVMLAHASAPQISREKTDYGVGCCRIHASNTNLCQRVADAVADTCAQTARERLHFRAHSTQHTAHTHTHTHTHRENTHTGRACCKCYTSLPELHGMIQRYPFSSSRSRLIVVEETKTPRPCANNTPVRYMRRKSPPVFNFFGERAHAAGSTYQVVGRLAAWPPDRRVMK